MESFNLILQNNLKFPEEICLEGTWQVGLSEITFTKTWFTIPKKQRIDLLYYNPMKTSLMDSHFVHDSYIKEGNYTLVELADELNKAVKKHFVSKGSIYDLRKDESKIVTKFPRVEIENDNIIFKAGVIDKREFIFIRPTLFLTRLLGIDFLEIHIDAGEIYHNYKEILKNSPFLPEIKDEHIHHLKYPDKFRDSITRHLYVNCDIIEENLFGEVYKPLLKIVTVPYQSAFSDTITIKFDKPEYHYLKKYKFDKINISIKDKLNYLKKQKSSFEDNIDFKFGYFFVTLNFRKVSNEKFNTNLRHIFKNVSRHEPKKIFQLQNEEESVFIKPLP